MDLFPFASITADKATRRHFAGGSARRAGTGPAGRQRRATPTAAVSASTAAAPAPTGAGFHGVSALRARVAELLYRGAHVVEPCGYQRSATH